MITIDANEVRPGVVVVYRGQPRRVTRVEHATGWSWPVAFDGTGWAMALGGDLLILDPSAGTELP